MPGKLEIFRKAFAGSYRAEPQHIARAPGRIELLGNHTDYNLGEVLGMTVDRELFVGVRARKDDRFCFRSENEKQRQVEWSRDDGSITRHNGKEESWVNYPLGVLKLMIQDGMEVNHGFDLGVWSDLPAGAGMSSSAALEAATALALGKLYHFPMEGRTLVKLCWRAETEFVGMPCGILDQSVVVHGQCGKVVWIDCKRGSIKNFPLPQGCGFWIFNTAEKHSLVDSLYAQRNRECMEARSTLKTIYPEMEGLCDLAPEQVEREREILGEDPLKRALHVTGENRRVRDAVSMLEKNSGDLSRLGDLFWESHESSRNLFENSTEHLDFLVEHLKLKPGVHGARLTGGGFGGAVLALCDPSFRNETAREIDEAYEREFGKALTSMRVKTAPGAS